MFNKTYLFGILFFSLTLLNCQNSTINKEPKITFKVSKTDKDWKEELSPEEYEILREKGTERPFTGKYVNTFDKGVYVCAGCDNLLFYSDAKFHVPPRYSLLKEILEGMDKFCSPLRPTSPFARC